MNINTENLESNREQWASIDGYRNYEISWWGRVRNIDTGRILKPQAGGHGYHHVNLSRNVEHTIHKIHKLVAREWVPNPDGKICVDHIDGCKTNNHHGNLRFATHSENSRNMKKHSDGSSVYKGVSYKKRLSKWTAQMHMNGKQTYLGVFTSEREAAEAYNAAALEHYGAFAKLNEFSDIFTSEREAAEAALTYLR